MHIPDDIWISTKDVADLYEKSERWVRLNIGLWRNRLEAGKLHIQLSSLPQPDAERFMALKLPHVQLLNTSREDTDLVLRSYEKASVPVKRHFDKWSLILQKSDGIVGNSALRHWVKVWNADNPQMQTSAPSIYRMRKKVDEQGRICLLDDRAARTSSIRDDWWDWFKAIYLVDQKNTLTTAWRVAYGKAKDAGHVSNESEFPSASSFLRRVNREIAPGSLHYARAGKKQWENRYSYSMERDYTSIPAGSVWVGDTRTWDVMIKLPGRETPATTYVTLFIDQRTLLPMGWHLHYSAPSTDNTLRALRNGIEKYGVPEHLYVDNGREYRNKDFSGQTRGHKICDNEQWAESVAARLSIRMHFAIVRNARTKIIERQFLNIKNGFDRLFASFKGGNVAEKPESLKGRIKRGDVIEWGQFCELANEYMSKVFPGIKSQGKILAGKSPAQAWLDLYPQRACPLNALSADSLLMITTRHTTSRIGPRGVRFADLDCTWWADWMAPRVGIEVILRYDPEDLSVAWIYDNDSLLGEATLTKAVGVLVAQDDVIGAAQVKEGVARRKRQNRVLREIFPELPTSAAAESIKALVTAVAAPDTSTAPSSTRITRHDHDAKALTDAKVKGRGPLADLLPFPEIPQQQTPLRIWDEPVAKIG